MICGGELLWLYVGALSVTLMKDLRRSGRYMVADRWTSDTFYEEWKRAHSAEYREIGERGSRLWDRESEVGRFDFVD